MKNDEWFKIEVTFKSTTHKLAPDIIADIRHVIDRHYPGANAEIEHFWGREPKPKKKPKYKAVEEAGRLASKQLEILRRAVASTKGAK